MHDLILGILLGVSAGFAPGPVLTLVISETLRHGVRSGIRVAIAPLFTDLPIILVTLLVLSRLSGLDAILGGISIAGGLFVLWMGVESLRVEGMDPQQASTPPQSLIKGMLANALSPHPYLFWLTVGAPITTEAMQSGIGAAARFIVSFYAALVGSKILLALITGRSRAFLAGRLYRNILRLLGLMLILLAFLLFQDGFERLGACPT
ncbi:LysE family transporter [Thiorhodococcus mannitoliphagus]|uniref:LysE family transporter n=1 Tax=Thiorhodococcus mannitoliphagus TaxID=329406 RepID=A0A6P1DY63_9GAMM|nr:LysE family transporter [Thiorhodococcus mannitoliphagus]NEX23257.1 LysE family transporter [Thiorhodococcus mannitoliphagus]